MNRGRAERWLSRYLDGELDARRTARLEQLLADDPALRTRAAAWKAGGDLLRARGGEAPDAATGWADVRTALARERAASRGTDRSPLFGWRPAAVAATLALLLAAIGLGRWARDRGEGVASVDSPEAVEVEWAETELPGASTMVFRDEETGLTVIWLVESGDTEVEHAGS